MTSILADRATLILVTALCAGATTTVTAQQPSGVAPRASQAPSTVLAGPRLKAEWPRYEPRVAQSNTTTSALLAGGSNHTFVFSTLALVIIGVLVLVLVL